MNSLHHSFDIDLAKRYGVECAILIHHFQHWIRVNRRCKRNIRDGKCWTFQTRKEIQAHFGYWTFEEVKYLCEKLVALDVLVTANYNKIKIDKTLWYAFKNEELFGVDDESSNKVYEREKSPSRGKIPSPIPDTKTEDISIPPLPPPQKEVEPSPSKQEEEEIERRFRERPLGSKKVVSKTAWKREVLKDMRLESDQPKVSKEMALKHKLEAIPYDLKSRKGMNIVCCAEHVEFTNGSYIKEVRYDITDEEWKEKTGFNAD